MCVFQHTASAGNNIQFSFYGDVIFRVLEGSVTIDIPCLKGVLAGRAGIEKFDDLVGTPGPEAVGCHAFGNRQLHGHKRAAIRSGYGLSVLPGLRIVADGVIEGVLHATGLKEVAHEHVLLTTGSEVVRLGFGRVG